MKVAVMGDYDSICAFSALGFDAFSVTEKKETEQALVSVAESGEYAVVFITEDAVRLVGETVARYKDVPTVSIIPIPGAQGSTGYGTAFVRDAVIQAVGSDIIFDGE